MAVASYTPTTAAGGATTSTGGAFPGSSALTTITSYSGLSKADLNLPVKLNMPDSQIPAPVAGTGQPVATTVTVGQAITQFLAMSPTDQANLANRLWQAGQFDSTLYRYVQDQGRPPTIRPIDIQSAYARALRDAAHAGVAFDDFLSQESQTAQTTLGNVGQLPSVAGGAGAGRVGIHGGGQKFVVDLSNPDDVAMVAQQVAQGGLHRNFNDSELNAIVAHMQTSQAQDALAKNQASEAQTYQDFLARQESRDIFQGGGSSSAGTTGATDTTGTTPAGPAPTGSVVQIITQVANQLGVDPKLAVAIAQHESGLDPNAVGDQGTSFGLFQLHQGGELGNLTPEQAKDPATNARVALAQVAAVAKAHPDWSPGQIAAAAQRPADPAAYAKAVNTNYGSPDAPTQPMTFSQPGQDSPNDVYVPSVTTTLTPAADASAAAFAYMRSQDATEYTENQYSDQATNMAKALASLGTKSAAAPGPASGA